MEQTIEKSILNEEIGKASKQIAKPLTTNSNKKSSKKLKQAGKQPTTMLVTKRQEEKVNSRLFATKDATDEARNRASKDQERK